MKKPVVRFDNYSFKYQAQAETTLKDINLTIYEGEKVLIIGPSGSGKSTIGNCINGLIPFSYSGEISGKLFVGELEARNKSLFDISKIVGTVLQDTDAQFVGLTVGEDIAFSLENDCMDVNEMHKVVKDAATKVGIETHLSSYPHELSGGQKQRVSLAGVIVDDVNVLLFDEPLANLDPATGKQTIELIDQIQKETLATVIIIEHRLEDVLHCKVDRIVLMSEGRIIADTTPDDLLYTNILRDVGIREPLYLTALRYASIEIKKDMEVAYINTLKVTDYEIERVKSFYSKMKLPVDKNNTIPQLALKNISFAYDKNKPVIKDISLEIYKGDIVSIVGTNGAGKSTLAKLICGFEKENSGKIIVNGKNIEKENIFERANYIGYVMQNPNQMISKSMIFDEVALGLQKKGLSEEEIKKRVDETLDTCGLHSMRNWPISALSFGQKKRVTIASLLVSRPNILILDEPTAGQDFKHYTDIMEFLEKLNNMGMTIIMVTHDMHLMLEYATRTLVIHDGKLISDSTPAEVLTDSDIIKKASLKETSLYEFAVRFGIENANTFVQHFTDYDREVRELGRK